MGVEIKLSQGLSLSPRMLLSTRILQMGAAELTEYLKKLGEENPAVELEAGPAGAGRFRAVGAGRDTGGLEAFENVAAREDASLRQSLLFQLDSTPLSPEISAAARYIINSLGDGGMLEQSADSLRRAAGLEEGLFAAALATVRYMEPAGVAAEDLSQCLLLQLERLDAREPLAELIVRSHLRLLAKNRLDLICRAVSADMEDVERACRVIRSLSPRPAGSFGPRAAGAAVLPDCIVSRNEDGELTLDFADALLPTLSVSPYYARMLRQSDDEDVRKYLTEKINQAKWTIYSIQQRKNTVLRCIAFIAARQEEFFTKGSGRLRPLTMADIAVGLGLNVSTVSRAVRDKYIQCDAGVLPVKSLLSRGMGSRSARDAREELRRLIAAEAPGAPMSDQRLSQALEAAGFEISRRTVAKYRNEMNIPDAYGRRRR